MNPLEFVGQYVDIAVLIFGLLLLGVGVFLVKIDNQTFDTSKLGQRLGALALLTVGIFLILQTISGIGLAQATAIALIALFFGSFWIIGAKGWIATVIGILLVMIFAVIIGGYTNEFLPTSSPIRIAIDAVVDSVVYLWNVITGQLSRNN